jgi:hypothetical protein
MTAIDPEQISVGELLKDAEELGQVGPDDEGQPQLPHP